MAFVFLYPLLIINARHAVTKSRAAAILPAQCIPYVHSQLLYINPHTIKIRQLTVRQVANTQTCTYFDDYLPNIRRSINNSP